MPIQFIWLFWLNLNRLWIWLYLIYLDFFIINFCCIAHWYRLHCIEFGFAYWFLLHRSLILASSWSWLHLDLGFITLNLALQNKLLTQKTFVIQYSFGRIFQCWLQLSKITSPGFINLWSWWTLISDRKMKTHGPEQKENVIGIGNFFSIHPTIEHALLRHKIRNRRVSPKNINQVLAQSESSGPVFIETHNYFEIPKSYKGMLCALVVPDNSQIWRFGIVHSIKSELDVLEVYVWCGGTVHQPNPNKSTGNPLTYPAFCSTSFADMMNQSVKEKF